MFFDLKEAQKEGNFLTWDALNELADWTPVKITETEELLRGKKNGDAVPQPKDGVPKRQNVYHVVTFETIECGRSFKISFFRQRDLIEMMTNALKMVTCKHHSEIIGKKLSVKLGVEHNEKNDKRYIKIEESRPYTGEGDVTKLKDGQGGDIPF